MYEALTSERAEPAGSAFFYCFAALLLLAPLDAAGNAPLPMLLLELAAIGLLFVIVAVDRTPLRLLWPLTVSIGLLLAYPLMQLVPLPGTLWAKLPGHAEYAMVLERFAAPGAADRSRALSIIPVATEYGWLALLPPLACLLAAMRLSTRQASGLLLIMVAFAGAESLLGLLQVGVGGSLLEARSGVRGFASGTFVNRDHLSAMLAMMLPVAVSLLVYSLRPGAHRSRRSMAASPSETVAKRALLFASAVSILVCLVFTGSRAGLALGLVALVASGVVLERARAANRGDTSMRAAALVVTALVSLGAIVALVIGAEPLVGRFGAGALHDSAQGRLEFYVATLRAAIDFFPFGSGLSTFAYVFPRFQTGDLAVAIDYAHNDYVQAFLELGVVAPVIVGLLLVAYAAQMTRLLRRTDGHRFTLLQIGAGVGLLPMILHSLVDFPLHMPANAMWFATLAGILFHRGGSPDEELRRHRSEVPRSA